MLNFFSMKKNIKPLLLACSTFFGAFEAAAEPLSQEQVACYESIMRDTYPEFEQFNHSISNDGQERLYLHDGTRLDSANIIFWNHPNSPDFSIHRYDHENNGNAIIREGGGEFAPQHITRNTAAPEGFGKELLELRDRIRNKDCNRSPNRRLSPPALPIS
jgi:hypothetical protein